MKDLQLFFFGMPRIEFQGKNIKIKRRKSLALAAYLALAEPRQSREYLASLFWPELDSEHARSALRTTLHALIGPVPVAWIDADGETLAIKENSVWVDVQAFSDLLHRRSAHGHRRELVCDECLVLYRQALALYRADFLAGFTPSYSTEYDDWQRAQRQWLRWEYAVILQRLAESYGEQGDYQPALEHALQWLALDPLHEPAHRLLMTVYLAAGQRTRALQQYERCVELLDSELAAQPEAETNRLYENILHNRPFPGGSAAWGPRSAAVNVLPPLPTLVIGRQDAVAEIKRRLGVGGSERRPVTALQGWPGVGKSTLAAKLAHDPEIAARYPDGVLWAALGESPNILGELSTWVEALAPGDAARARSVEEVAAQLTNLLQTRRTLLVLDDVWRVEHALPFRVGGEQCALLVTSRMNDVALALAPTAADIYRLPVLTEVDGLSLFGALAPEILERDPAGARELVRGLEGLPLAINVAGRLLHSEARLGWGLRELLAEIRSGAALLQAPAPSDMLPADQPTALTVSALLKRSTDLLDAEARRRFALLGLFVPKPATFDLPAMAAAWNTPDPRPTARLLVNRGLLEPVSGGRFQMHALLVLHARSLAPGDAS